MNPEMTPQDQQKGDDRHADAQDHETSSHGDLNMLQVTAF
jgi:hypothetical protein